MLVLQRKKGQSLLLGEDIKISVVEITPEGVKLAIEAPKEIKILREELAELAKINEQSVVEKSQLNKLKDYLQKS